MDEYILKCKCGREYEITKTFCRSIMNYLGIKENDVNVALNEIEEVCANCGKKSYNHLNMDGIRTSTGIYCNTKSMSKFSPSANSEIKFKVSESHKNK